MSLKAIVKSISVITPYTISTLECNYCIYVYEFPFVYTLKPPDRLTENINEFSSRYVLLCADQSHRIPSYQPDQLIEHHLYKKQCGTRYNVPSSICIHILLSVYLSHYTYTIK